jgi:hypothetical protein
MLSERAGGGSGVLAISVLYGIRGTAARGLRTRAESFGQGASAFALVPGRLGTGRTGRGGYGS